MKLKVLKIITWVASLGLVSSALFFAYIILFPVDVLQNWQLRINKDNYSLGETVVIESLYTKTTNTTSKSVSKRYLECKNQNGVYVRYLLNEAAADRDQSKSTGTGVVVTIPVVIAEVSLPTDCFFSISITYDVYPRQATPEYARSQVFILSQKPIEKAAKTDKSKVEPVTTYLPTGSPVAPQAVSQEPAKAPQPTPVSRPEPIRPIQEEKTGLRTIPLIDGTLNLIGL